MNKNLRDNDSSHFIDNRRVPLALQADLLTPEVDSNYNFNKSINNNLKNHNGNCSSQN